MGFDRSKFKPTPMAALKAQEQELENIRPTNSGRPGYLDIKPGANKFRFFPAHPDGGGKTYSEAKCITFLECEGPARDASGRIIEGQTEIKRRPIWNSKVHGGLPKDLVEEYLQVAKNIAIPAYTDDTVHQGNIWGHISNGFSGIRPSDSWVVYASKWEGSGWGDVGLLELKKSITVQLRDLAAEFAGDDPVSPDPFTDPDDGIAVIITKTGEKLKTEYKASLDKEQITKFETRLISSPLTDAQLEAFSKLDPLYKIYVNSFKMSDFESQLSGLKAFDDSLAKPGAKDKNGVAFTTNIGVFQYDEFQNAIDEILSTLPSEDDDQPAQQENPEPEDPQMELAEVDVEIEVEEPVKIAPRVTRPAVTTKAAAHLMSVQNTTAVATPPPTAAPNDRLAAIRARLGKK
jgi:hypothetical protein